MADEDCECCGSTVSPAPTVDLTEDEARDWQNKGYLAENGICNFPSEEMGFDPGWRGRIYGQTYEDAKEAFENGWAKLIDTDSAALTLAMWYERYPGKTRPDPIKQLFLQGRLPPQNQFTIVRVAGAAIIPPGAAIQQAKPVKKYKQLSRLPQFRGGV